MIVRDTTVPNTDRPEDLRMVPALQYLSRQSPPVLLALALTLMALIGVLDYSTHLSVEILYLLPIALVTWGIGRPAGLALAGACAAVLLLADLLTSAYPSILRPLWNALVDLGIFLAWTLALAAARDLAHQRLRQEIERAEVLARADELK